MQHSTITWAGTTFHTTKHASTQVGLSHDYIARLARHEKVQAVQVGRTWYVDLASLHQFITVRKWEKQVYARLVQRERQAEKLLKERACQVRWWQTPAIQIRAAVRAMVLVCVVVVAGALSVDHSATAPLAASLERGYETLAARVTAPSAPVVVTSQPTPATTTSYVTAVTVPWQQLGVVPESHFATTTTAVRSWFSEPVSVAWQNGDDSGGTVVTTRLGETDTAVAFRFTTAARPSRDK